jgi:hypothetical protein
MLKVRLVASAYAPLHGFCFFQILTSVLIPYYVQLLDTAAAVQSLNSKYLTNTSTIQTLATKSMNKALPELITAAYMQQSPHLWLQTPACSPG